FFFFFLKKELSFMQLPPPVRNSVSPSRAGEKVSRSDLPQYFPGPLFYDE
ncbi:unnamed protein product, partial [Musa acuminata subsp. malaccensis]